MTEVQRAEDGRPVFVIGLTMAGAVSAGAYTAGVFDFLMRALAAHEAESARTGKGPKIVLKAISGTSAGGTTACLGVASLIAGIAESTERYAPPNGDGSTPYTVGLRKLHDIWVKELCLTGEHGLLGANDLDGMADLLSVLDGTAIDGAADRVLGEVAWAGRPYPFIAEPLDVFVTTTGIDGVVYEARFSGSDGSTGHLMARHGLARHFAVAGLGEFPMTSHWLEAWRDRGKPLRLGAEGVTIDFSGREALAAKGREPTVWTDFRETGIATGAFPGGLPARYVRATMGEHGVAASDGWAEGGAWPYEIDPDLVARPDWGAAEADAIGNATYVAVDGGACNNEPFELTRFAIRAPARAAGDGQAPAQWALEPNPRGAFDADRAVLMIDPFPEGPRFSVAWPDDPDGDARALPGLAGRLFGALIAQARFKPTELAAAMDSDVRSRHLIAPSREDEEGTKRRGAEAIASGALGGFSGFFHPAFRAHDFILGQRNCQRFLEQHFRLAAGNAVMNGGKRNDALTADRPVLMLGAALAEDIPAPKWPQMTLADLDTSFAAVGRRLDAVVSHVLRRERPVWLARVLARIGWSVWLRGIALRAVSRRIEAALLRHRLVSVRLPATVACDHGLRVLATLVAPGPDVRTALGVACAHAREDARAAARPAPVPPTAGQVAAVERVFEALEGFDVDHRYRCRRHDRRDGHQTWIVGDLGPGWARRNLWFLDVADDLPRRRR